MDRATWNMMISRFSESHRSKNCPLRFSTSIDDMRGDGPKLHAFKEGKHKEGTLKEFIFNLVKEFEDGYPKYCEKVTRFVYMYHMHNYSRDNLCLHCRGIISELEHSRAYCGCYESENRKMVTEIVFREYVAKCTLYLMQLSKCIRFAPSLIACGRVKIPFKFVITHRVDR